MTCTGQEERGEGGGLRGRDGESDRGLIPERLAFYVRDLDSCSKHWKMSVRVATPQSEALFTRIALWVMRRRGGGQSTQGAGSAGRLLW